MGEIEVGWSSARGFGCRFDELSYVRRVVDDRWMDGKEEGAGAQGN